MRRESQRNGSSTSTKGGARMVLVARRNARLDRRIGVHRAQGIAWAIFACWQPGLVVLLANAGRTFRHNEKPPHMFHGQPTLQTPVRNQVKNAPNLPNCQRFASPDWRNGIFRRSGRTSRSPWPNDDVDICLRGHPEMVSEFDFPAARGLDTGLPRSVCLRNARHFRVSGLPHPFSW